MSNVQQPPKSPYYAQRPYSPNSSVIQAQSAKNLSLTMSIGANQNANSYLPFAKQKQDAATNKVDFHQKYERLEADLKTIHKENSQLREQNDHLKKELLRFKKQLATDHIRSPQKYVSNSPEPFNDLRGTIKKEVGELKEFKLKLEMLSKQCKIYEEIIDKMDDRIKKLTNQNNKKSTQIDELKTQINKLDYLKQKVNVIMKDYGDLQSKMNNSQLQWIIWKEEWYSEKEFYINRIKELQKLNRDANH